MSDFQAIADRVEIEALRAEFTDAVMMRDYDRVASLFAQDGALRMPNVPVELTGREEIRGRGGRALAIWDYFVQNTDGWKFTERVYEIRYLDTTPLAGSAPHAAGTGR